MADLSIRTYFTDGSIIGKVINQESLSICSQLTPTEVRAYIQANRPVIWTLMQSHGTELPSMTCPHDATKTHYILMLDRP